jgi:hypothetical protein
MNIWAAQKTGNFFTVHSVEWKPLPIKVIGCYSYFLYKKLDMDIYKLENTHAAGCLYSPGKVIKTFLISKTDRAVL